MQEHVRVYFKYFGIRPGEWPACENCGKTGQDVHHLTPRNISSKGKANLISNLILLCRTCHQKAHASREFNHELRLKHMKKVMAVDSSKTEKYLK